MAKNIYALLIGINDYEGNVSKLRGCVNDVLAMRDFLAARAGSAAHIRLLTAGHHSGEERPTRNAVIAAIRAHLRQAGPDDVALLYYSGHGSYEDAPPEFWAVEPDRRNETLVCCDSRLPGRWDLADKELAKLIQEVATLDAADNPKAGSPHIALLVDCCHSGSISRNADDACERLTGKHQGARTAADYIVGAAELTAQSRGAGDDGVSGWALGWADHVLMAACRSDQTAKERAIDGAQRGIFTHTLLKLLQETRHALSYRDLARALSPIVRNSIDAQDPQLEAVGGADLNRIFLEGALREAPRYFRVFHDAARGAWLLDGGIAHGIQAPRDGEHTTFALFDANADLSAVRSLDDRLGVARVLRVTATHSDVALDMPNAAPSTDAQFQALLLGVPMPPVAVHFEGNAAMLDAVRAALADTTSAHPARQLIRETQNAADAMLRLHADAGAYTIRQSGSVRAFDIAIPTSAGASSASSAVLDRLAHIARWRSVLDLTNPATRLAPVPARRGRPPVEIVLRRSGESEPLTGALVRGNQKTRDRRYPSYEITLVNNTAQRLYVGALLLSDRYEIAADLKSPGWLEAYGETGSEAKVLTPNGNARVYFYVDADLEKTGVTQANFVLSVIAATTEFLPADLAQSALADAKPRSETRDAGKNSTLNRILRRVHTRGAGDMPGSLEEADDWVTTSVAIETIAEPDQQRLPDSGDPLRVAGSALRVHAHGSLRDATIAIDSAASAPRAASAANAGNMPPWLAAQGVQPLALNGATADRSADALSVATLEFQDAAAPARVSAQDPLRFTLDQPLAEDEAVLVTVYDAATGLYLPAGFGATHDGATEIAVTALPEATPGPVMRGGERSVKSALTLAFHKIVGAKLGTGADVNTLWLCTLNADGTLRRSADLATTRAAIGAAERVLVFVHGFTGDSDSMPLAAWHLMQPGDPATVVLAYDYENLLTEIQDTALRFRDALHKAGLTSGHGKQVTLIAHSLGTMVTRWLIEQTPGGKDIVQRALLVGGPNAGTPAARAEDLLAFLLGAAINGLLTLAFPWAIIPKLLGALATGVVAAKNAIKTLDQIKPGAAFYNTLNDPLADPGVPYTVIAGDVNLLLAQGGATARQHGLLALANKYRLAGLLFAGKPNDMIISVESIQAVPETRTPKPVLLPVLACDHVSYFAHADALAQMRAALAQ